MGSISLIRPEIGQNRLKSYISASNMAELGPDRHAHNYAFGSEIG